MEKRSVGRPPSLGGEATRQKITFYLHPADKRQIEEAAQGRGMAVSELIRRAVKFYLTDGR